MLTGRCSGRGRKCGIEGIKFFQIIKELQLDAAVSDGRLTKPSSRPSFVSILVDERHELTYVFRLQTHRAS